MILIEETAHVPVVGGRNFHRKILKRAADFQLVVSAVQAEQ
jgi:hypothetical protein